MPVEVTLNVVVVEAGPARPDAICRMLSDTQGVSVRGVSTVKAVDALGSFDAIVIDLKRSSQQGLDDLDYLRSRLRPDAAIISVVGRNDTVLGSEAIRMNAQDCIIRENLSPEVLSAVLHSAVSRSRLQHGMRELIETNPDGMLVVCPQGRILFVNRACQKMMVRDESSLVGQDFGVPMVSRDTVEVQLGDGLHAEMRTVETQWAGRKALLVSLRDITRRKLAEKDIWTRANFDELTKLPNRALFIDRLDNAIAASRRSNQSIGLMFIDLDRLKWVNDTFGHTAGDQVLRITAKRLQSCIRESDTVARLSGDEFVILLANINAPQGTERVARKVLDDIARIYKLKDNIEISVSVSIGIALCPENARDVYGLLNSADTAMYQAKAEGRNGYAFYSREMHDNALSHMSLEQDLRHAIEHDELALHYQPVVDLDSGQIRNVEALLRWVHPTRGLLDTHTVIEIASHSRLLNHLDDWVLEHSAQQAKEWKGCLFSPPRIWVNLASDRRKDAAFDEVLDETLANHGLTIADSSIGVEITQRCKIDESRETHELLNRIRSQGVQLAFDDFLEASSSINHLRNLPFDVVKIDRSAIRSITEHEEDRGVVISLIEMAHRLKLKTVAEGVETLQQLNILRQAGCDAGQGFLFSRAVPAAEITEMLANPRSFPTH